MPVYAEEIALARELIQDFGQDALLVRPSSEPSQVPWEREGALESTHAMRGVFLEEKASFLSGSTVEDKSSLVLSPPLLDETLPQPGDLVERDGVRHQVTRVWTLSPNGEIILHELEIRS